MDAALLRIQINDIIYPSVVDKSIFVLKRKYQLVMFGPDIDVMGGISFVVLEYLKAGLHKKTVFTFIPTTKDGSRAYKVYVFFCAVIKTLAVLLKTRNTICHIHVSQDGSFYRKILILMLAKCFRKKVIIHLHGAKFQAFMKKSVLNLWLSRIMFIKADLVITLSEQWKKIVSTFCKSARVIKIYNPVHLQDIKVVHEKYEGIRVLFLGRLSQRKGTYDLLDCIKRQRSFYLCEKVKFILAGDGDIKETRDYIRKNALDAVVDVPGWVSGIKKLLYLSNADIYILPSYNEQMPMSILEAMAFGLPIISTNIAGIPEMVIENKNGFLVEPGDKENLTAALAELVKNPKTRKRMGEESLKRVAQKFDARVIVEQLITIYDNL